jgi:FAD/FMN-containing dehydrogenase
VKTEPLHGWGRFPTAEGTVHRARDLEDLCRLAGGPASLIGRGAARSYGDAAVAADVVSTVPLRHLLDFDPGRGRVRAQAGVSLDDLIRFVLPRGWFPPVTPGTRYATLGGCVAADVHGKNHHRDGAFSAFVDELEVVLAGGDVVCCSREMRPDLFWATLGGMGLTGLVHAVQLRLRPLRSVFVDGLSLRTGSLRETCQVLLQTQEEHLYSVAWIDALPHRGRGRGLVLLGDHATDGRLTPLHRNAPWRLPALPVNVVRGFGLRLANALYHRRQLRRRRRHRVHYEPYFYPLDGIDDWNRAYGRRGFVQFQFVVPFDDGESVMSEVMDRAGREAPCSLAVLKTFGDHDAGPLGFPMPGYTLALDFARTQGIEAALRVAADVVAAAGGRVYLAKDAILTPEQVDAMYPRLDEFRSLRRQIDPAGHFRSRLSDRTGLT